jgi:hypothetical protein
MNWPGLNSLPNPPVLDQARCCAARLTARVRQTARREAAADRFAAGAGSHRDAGQPHPRREPDAMVKTIGLRPIPRPSSESG